MIEEILELNNSNKIEQAVKESHRLCQNLILKEQFDELNDILNYLLDKEIHLNVLTAFIVATNIFKRKFSNRHNLFLKLEILALNELGEERLNKSMFYNLK